jgi:hypothetical protein
MRIIFSFCLLIVFSHLLSAQGISLTGRVYSANLPVQEVQVVLEGTGKMVYPNANGFYQLDQVMPGNYFISFDWQGTLHAVRQINITDKDLCLEDITLAAAEGPTKKHEQSNIILISASEEDLESEDVQGVSSLLTASRDVFTSTAAFSFGTFRFRQRGYDSEYANVYLNGLLMNEVESGYARFSNWGGLNDVMRNRDNNVGLAIGPFGFGSVGGFATIDTRASKQLKKTYFSYAATNRDYTHRIMGSYSSGMMPKGWAVTVAASMRYANEGYVEGTFYRGASFFAGVDKKLKEHLLSLTVLGAPTMRGRSSTAVSEVYKITDNKYYNSFWGYQEGGKRNASVATNFQPMAMLTHEWTKPNQMSWLTTVGVQYGRNALTALDWYDARDPRPDYYGYLPSYYKNKDEGLQEALYQYLSDRPELMQIDWDAIYEANRNAADSVVNANGISGNTVYGKKARYLLEERRTDVMRIGMNSVYDRFLNDFISIRAGIGYQFENSNYYKVADDLLGADFHVDINKFAIDEFPNDPNAGQNDLDNLNRIVKQGDRYGYDYDNIFHRASFFGQANFSYNKVDFFGGIGFSMTSFWREGNVRNGQFPDGSAGKSDVLNFFNYGVKAGLAYKINGRNYFILNGQAETRSPQFRDVFVSPRTRNQHVSGDLEEQVYASEAGYYLRTPNVKLKAVFYYTQFMNQTKTLSFFHDDLNSFVNYTLTGIDKRHMGGELGIEYKLMPELSLSAAIAIGQYIYTSRPEATITQDNNSAVLVENETIYLRNYYVGGMPQNAYNVGLRYSSPKFWFANVNANYAHRFWVDPSPARRTQGAVDVIEGQSEQWQAILDQEEIPGNFTVDLFGGYSWKLNKGFKGMKNNHYLYFTIGVNNILNNKSIINTAFEQLRYDFDGKDPERFPTKYAYSPGINYFLNVAFRL